ncbi:MAG TPA: capsular polysaccharide synthesis protein, partial [Pyrinomonadaceae bacterium]|nr:capsular polysaccharide synthesis protein [Pyrinomonadaceae bacterium]
LIVNEDFDLSEAEKFSSIGAILAVNQPVELKIKNPRLWIWKNENPQEPDLQGLALALAQPLSLILGGAESKSGGDTASVNSQALDLPVWFYWEGARPEWIEECHRTILAKCPNARFLTPETFDELWTTDRDIDISRLYVAHRADFIRAFLLAKFGGLWIDADCVVMRDLQFLLAKLGEYDFIAHRERNGLFTNDFMAAKPGSIIARELYENICRTLRANQTISWRAIGGEPLTEILNKTGARFLELDCRQIQPICWSEPEKFFAAGSEAQHEHNFDRQAICYMLSNGAVINYQKKFPNADLTAENTFFKFIVRRALGEKTVKGDSAAENKDFLSHSSNGEKAAHSEASKNEIGWQSLVFYLEMMAKIAPQKVVDLDVGYGRWAVLLRDLFEPSRNKKEWRMSIEAIVEEKSKSTEKASLFYDIVRVGQLDKCFQSIEEKQDLLILGDYLSGDSRSRSEKILEQTLSLADYILLNLKTDKNGNGTNHPNNGEAVVNYLERHGDQIVIRRHGGGNGCISLLLSQNDPKKLRSKTRMTEVFHNAAQFFSQQKQESISGPGSSLIQTAEIRRSLPLLFASLEINSMLDAPCGDFNWLRYVDLRLEKYVGIDVVPSIIEQNRNRYENPNRKFIVSDLTADFLPRCDLILCRDCLVHFPFAEIFSALRNFCGSGAKYLLTTTFPKTQANRDIKIGDWRTLNLQLPPFNFPAPLQLINEHCTEGNGKFADKSLGLWNISDISRLVNFEQFL